MVNKANLSLLSIKYFQTTMIVSSCDDFTLEGGEKLPNDRVEREIKGTLLSGWADIQHVEEHLKNEQLGTLYTPELLAAAEREGALYSDHVICRNIEYDIVKGIDRFYGDFHKYMLRKVRVAP